MQSARSEEAWGDGTMKVEIEVHERLIEEFARTCIPERITTHDKIVQLIEEWVMVCNEYEKSN